MTLSVGLTGGLASGKSVVAGMFASRGAYVMRADEAGRELMQPGQAVYDDILGAFGECVINSDRSINRAKLAEIAFGGGRIEELNHIVHPAVRTRLEHWIEEMSDFDPQALLIFEAALILEAGLGKYFDKLIVVTSYARQKLERFAGRVLDIGVQDEAERAKALREAERRIGAQLSEEEKIAAADYVIDNSGALAETELQVAKIAKELQLLASAKQRASNS
jgi:dephospho-CoA kinase